MLKTIYLHQDDDHSVNHDRKFVKIVSVKTCIPNPILELSMPASIISFLNSRKEITDVSAHASNCELKYGEHINMDYKRL